MIVWLLSSDYFFSSQLQGNLHQSGFEMRQIVDSGSFLEKSTAGKDVNGTDVNGTDINDTDVNGDVNGIVVIDLSFPGLDLQLVTQLRSADNPPKAIIAFGPHVAEEKLCAAQKIGCDQVLTKGQAHRELGRVIQKLVSA